LLRGDLLEVGGNLRLLRARLRPQSTLRSQRFLILVVVGSECVELLAGYVDVDYRSYCDGYSPAELELPAAWLPTAGARSPPR
jgi:hypothetical protein